MPFPLIPIIIAITTAAGAASAARSIYKTIENFIEADEIVDKAKYLVEIAELNLENTKKEYAKVQESLINLRKNVIKTVLSMEFELSQQLRERIYSLFNEELRTFLNEIGISEEHKRDFLNYVDYAKKVAMSGVATTLTPKIIEKSMFEIVTQIGKTSTGRAISGLTGIARTNAIYAWLGGGAKAAGGFGMTAGQILTSASSIIGGISIATLGLELISMKYLNDAKKEAEELSLQASDIGLKTELIQRECKVKEEILNHLAEFNQMALRIATVNIMQALKILEAIILNINYILNNELLAYYGEEFAEKMKFAMDNVIRRL